MSSEWHWVGGGVFGVGMGGACGWHGWRFGLGCVDAPKKKKPKSFSKLVAGVATSSDLHRFACLVGMMVCA
jgi:hypothetical protein